MSLRFAQTVVKKTSIRANTTLVLQLDISAASNYQANRDITETILGKVKVFDSTASISHEYIFLRAHNI